MFKLVLLMALTTVAAAQAKAGEGGFPGTCDKVYEAAKLVATPEPYWLVSEDEAKLTLVVSDSRNQQNFTISFEDYPLPSGEYSDGQWHPGPETHLCLVTAEPVEHKMGSEWEYEMRIGEKLSGIPPKPDESDLLRRMAADDGY
jgi:hypothetical protein